MTLKQISRHASHYAPLYGVLIVGVAGLSIFSYDKFFQVVIAVATAVAYVAWGIIHHALHKDLYLAVVIEYLAIALLGLTVIFSLVINA